MHKFAFSIVTFTIVLWFLPDGLVAQTDSLHRADSLLRIEQSLCDALPGDTATWSKYLDSKWYGVTENGEGKMRSAFLNEFSPFTKGVSGHIRVIRPVCLFHDSIAVVHYVADEYETFYGQKLHTSYAVTDTWYQTSGHWRMLGMQIFEIPQLPSPVPPAVADVKDFVGLYKLSENKTARIRLKNDTLYLEQGNRAPEILYQEMDHIFFVKNDARGRILFSRNTAGKMVMIERRNTQDVVWTAVVP